MNRFSLTLHLRVSSSVKDEFDLSLKQFVDVEMCRIYGRNLLELESKMTSFLVMTNSTVLPLTSFLDCVSLLTPNGRRSFYSNNKSILSLNTSVVNILSIFRLSPRKLLEII